MMRYLLFSVFLVVSSVNAQDVYTEVDVYPSYPGGTEAFNTFIQRNLRYPEEAKKYGKEGTVFVSTIVELDSTLSEIKLHKGGPAELNEEAMRLLASMGKWIPGKKKEKPVRVRTIVPIKFALTEQERKDAKKMIDTVSIFTVVESMPSFPGGSEKMYQFVGQNIKYPAAAARAGTQGTVFVAFVVEPNGMLSGIEVVMGIHPALDAEAVRIIALMPPWTPGEQSGKRVRVRYVLPIKFKFSIAGPEDTVYPLDNVDVAPSFTGGDEAMIKYFTEAMQYPSEAKEEGVKGIVGVQFIIMKDGSVSSPRVIKSVNEVLDAEAIRLIKNMPAWKPGKKGRKYANVWITVEVEFN